MDIETKTEVESEEPNTLIGVSSRTLGIRNLRKTNDKGEVVTEIAGVYGGSSANVWVASFADTREAQSFILASNYMGEMVCGIVIDDIPLIEVTDGAGKPN